MTRMLLRIWNDSTTPPPRKKHPSLKLKGGDWFKIAFSLARVLNLQILYRSISVFQYWVWIVLGWELGDFRCCWLHGLVLHRGGERCQIKKSFVVVYLVGVISGTQTISYEWIQVVTWNVIVNSKVNCLFIAWTRTYTTTNFPTCKTAISSGSNFL